MTMETIIVILIVGIAAAFIGRNFFQKFKKKGGVGSQCKLYIKREIIESEDLPKGVRNSSPLDIFFKLKPD